MKNSIGYFFGALICYFFMQLTWAEIIKQQGPEGYNYVWANTLFLCGFLVSIFGLAFEFFKAVSNFVKSKF